MAGGDSLSSYLHKFFMARRFDEALARGATAIDLNGKIVTFIFILSVFSNKDQLCG